MSDVYVPRTVAPSLPRPSVSAPRTRQQPVDNVQRRINKAIGSGSFAKPLPRIDPKKLEAKRLIQSGALFGDDGDTSIASQLKNNFTAAVTQGPAQILKAGAVTAVSPIRFAVDAISDPTKVGESIATAFREGGGGTRGFANAIDSTSDKYVPLPAIMADSLENSYRRNIDPVTPWNFEGPGGVVKNWKEASDRGETISAFTEDIGNAAILAGALGKVIGGVARPVEVGTFGERLAIQGATKGTPRAMGAAAQAAERAELISPPRTGYVGAADRAVAEVVKVPATIRGRGLAGAAERAGYTDMAQRLDTVGRGMAKARKVFDAPDNLTVGWQFAGGQKLAGLAGEAGVKLAGRLAPYANKVMRTEDNFLNRINDADARDRANVAREIRDARDAGTLRVTRTGAQILDVAKKADLDQAEANVALNLLDQRYSEYVEAVRELPEDAGRELVGRLQDQIGDPRLAPTYEDLRAIINFTDGTLDPVKTEAITTTSRLLEQYAGERTNVQLDKGMNPEQLGNEMLTPELNRQRGQIEAKRNKANRERSGVTGSTYRAIRVEQAQQAINATLPDPPSMRVGIEQGRRAGLAQAALRSLHQEHARLTSDLKRAVKEYEKADNATDDVVVALEKHIDQLVGEAQVLEDQIRTQSREIDATVGLSKASGRVETIDAKGRVIEDPQQGIQAEMDEIAQRPEPDLSNMPAHDAFVQTAREVVDDIKVEMYGVIERQTGGTKPSFIGPDGKPYDWYARLTTNEKKVFARDGWITKERTATNAPDMLAQEMSDAYGTDLSIDDAMERYFDSVREINDLRIRGNQARNRREKLKGKEIDPTTGKIVNRYSPGKRVVSDPVPDRVVEMVADRMGVNPRIARAALDGNVTKLREAMAEETIAAYDEIRSTFDTLDPESRQAVLDGVEFETGNLFDYLADTLDLDRDVRLITDGTVTGQALLDWLRGTDPKVPETFMRAVRETAGPAQQKFLARLQQSLKTSRERLRENYTQQRRIRPLLDRAKRAADDRVEDAAGRVDIAEIQMDAVAARIEDVEMNRPRLDQTDAVTPKSLDVWSRRHRTMKDPVTGEATTTTNMSTAERMRVREGRAVELRATKQREHNVITRRAQKYNDQIADLPNERARSHQLRLVEDVNQPAVRSWYGSVRSQGEQLGRYSPPLGDTPATVSGLMDSLTRAHNGTDGVKALTDYLGTRKPGGSAAERHQAFLDGLEDQGITLTQLEATRLRDSLATENVMEAMRAAEEAVGPDHMNMPRRVRAEIRRNYQWMPQEAINKLEAQFTRYDKSRNKHTREVWNDYVSVMPAPLRRIAQTNIRLIADTLDLADEAIAAGDDYLADIYMRLAGEAPTTLQDMIERGVDPVHLTGGRPVPEASAVKGAAKSGGIGSTTMRAQKQARTGLRPESLSDYVRLEIAEQTAQLNDTALAALRNHPGLTRRADAIPAVNEFIEKFKDEHRGMDPNAEELTAALDKAGWAPLPKSGAIFRGTPVVPKLALKQLGSQDMSTRPVPIRALSKANTLFKYTVLAASPLWQIGNLIGNIFMSTLGLGKMSVLDMPRLFRQAVKQSGGAQAFWQQGGLASWAPDELATHGLSYGEHQLIREAWDAAEGKRDNILKRAVNKSYSLNEFIDNSMRSMMYADQLQKGASSANAVKHTMRALGDFTNMTAFERRYVREVFPFWGWLRHQTMMTMRMPIYSPTRTAYLIALTDLLEEEDMADGWYQMLGSAIPLSGGNFLNLGNVSPFVSPLNLPLDPTNTGGQGPLSAVSPMIKFPVQAVTGFDLGQMRPTTRPYDERPTDNFGREVSRSPLRRLVLEQDIGGLKEIGYQAAGIAPQTRALREIAMGTGQSRYGSGQRVRDGEYDDESQTVIDEILAGLRVPRTQNKTEDLESLTQRLIEQRARGN